MNNPLSAIEVVDESLKRAESLRYLYADFSMPRSPVQIRAFVVGQHDTPMRQMHQCLLEIAIKDRSLRRHVIYRRQILRKIAALGHKKGDVADDRGLLEIDLEEQEEAMLGASRELNVLVDIFNSYDAEFSYEKWMAEEAEYWRKRLIRQAIQEIAYCGSIGVGNQDALAQIGINPAEMLEEFKRCKSLPEFLSGFGISALPSPDMQPAHYPT